MKAKRPPDSTTTETVDVDVYIDAEELEAAGWRYVGGDVVQSTDHVMDVVRDWHDDTHTQPWRFCDLEPCDSLRGREVTA